MSLTSSSESPEDRRFQVWEEWGGEGQGLGRGVADRTVEAGHASPTRCAATVCAVCMPPTPT